MTATCCCNSVTFLDPFKRAAFEKYARNWGVIIPDAAAICWAISCPMKARTISRWPLVSFESLAAYEAYRARLRAGSRRRCQFRICRAGAVHFLERGTHVPSRRCRWKLPEAQDSNLLFRLARFRAPP